MQDPKVGISVGLPNSIVQVIDKLRGDIPRGSYLRKMIITVVKDIIKDNPA